MRHILLISILLISSFTLKADGYFFLRDGKLVFLKIKKNLLYLKSFNLNFFIQRIHR